MMSKMMPTKDNREKPRRKDVGEWSSDEDCHVSIYLQYDQTCININHLNILQEMCQFRCLIQHKFQRESRVGQYFSSKYGIVFQTFTFSWKHEYYKCNRSQMYCQDSRRYFTKINNNC